MLRTLKNLPSDCARARVASPVGALTLVASSRGLHAVLWERDRREEKTAGVLESIRESPAHPVLALARAQLQEYFAGTRRGFDLPLVMEGTPFQRRAWTELSRIPYGETISYVEQAKRLGGANKARAVGTANSQNPISIIVPCHRVIAKSGALAGFGGGVENKRLLLALERSVRARGGPAARAAGSGVEAPDHQGQGVSAVAAGA